MAVQADKQTTMLAVSEDQNADLCDRHFYYAK